MSTGTKLDISVICAPAYWQFLLTEKHVVNPVLPSNCGVKKIVRVAYKSYQMNLPFDMCGVKPCNGKISMSHKDKLEEVQRERDHHFSRNFRIIKTSGSGYQICREFTKNQCSTCKHGKSNSKCSGKSCYKCFIKQDDVDCKVHKDNSSHKREAAAISKKLYSSQKNLVSDFRTVEFLLMGRYKTFKLGWEKNQSICTRGGGTTRRTLLYSLLGIIHNFKDILSL